MRPIGFLGEMVFVMFYFIVCMVGTRVFIYFSSLNNAYSLLYEWCTSIKRKQSDSQVYSPTSCNCSPTSSKRLENFSVKRGTTDGFLYEVLLTVEGEGVVLKISNAVTPSPKRPLSSRQEIKRFCSQQPRSNNLMLLIQVKGSAIQWTS